MNPTITAIDLVEFSYTLDDVARDPTEATLVYEPGSQTERTTYGIRIATDGDVAGEYVGGSPMSLPQMKAAASYLCGRNPLHRERHWHVLRRKFRQLDRTGIGPLDVALWDFAGKHHGATIHELLGTYRTTLPAYASTYFASERGGFEGPASFADFAAHCRDLGYPAFKLHTWSGNERTNVDREVATIRAVAERVGDEMALMHDPVCEYDTYAEALAVGKACDKYGYYWYEDPYGNGTSQHGHRLLRERLDTPLLQTELVRGLEPHIDFAVGDATDFLRADIEWDGGITGAMKIARAAEGLGLDVEFHLAGPAQRHCMAATRNSNYYEMGLIHPDSRTPHTEAPVYAGEYTDRVDGIAADGTVSVPTGDGLGVEYDWAVIDGAAETSYRFE